MSDGNGFSDWNGNENKSRTRMWANASRDGRHANIGGDLCSTPQSLPDAHYLTAVQ